MMATTTYQPSNPSLLDRINTPNPAYRASSAQRTLHPAATGGPQGANANPYGAPSPHAFPRDPLAYHRAVGDTCSSHPQASSQQGFPPPNDGCNHDFTSEAEDVQDCRNQQHARGRAVPYNLAVRLANRSNGAPLATIVEQGSYSTLNSRGSRLSVGPFPSLRVAENTSPGRRASLKVSPSPDDHALERIAEDAHIERVLDSTTRTPCKPYNKDSDALFPVDKVTTPSMHSTLDHPQTTQYQTGEMKRNEITSNSKGFFRGVLHNVRAASRTRSRSSSAHTSTAEHHEPRPETTDDGPNSHGYALEMRLQDNDRLSTPLCVPMTPKGVTLSSAPEHHNRDVRTLTADCARSARLDFPLHQDLEHPLPIQNRPVAMSQLSEPLTATRLYQRACSVRLVHPEARDEFQNGGRDDISILSAKSGNPNPNGKDFYGLSASSKATYSFTGEDRNKETSQNASFCSTVSTSYSGTVVGVDIDLQHDFPYPIPRSRSSTPVAQSWFTPQMAELERQVSATESPEAKRVHRAEPSRRSITSSALTTLLPIAAASGIIRPNYETPKISFFSPSGNLIQPEGSSTPGTTSASEFGGSPIVNASTCSKPTSASYSVFPATCLPPRPSLKPMTTPPTSSVPLPAHLRHYHNYRHPEKSQINSGTECGESFIVVAAEVKGCDGIVRTNTLSTHPQERRSCEETKACPRYKRHRSAGILVQKLRYEANSRKNRLITAVLASTTAKGRILHRRNSPTTHGSILHEQKSVDAVTSGNKRASIRHTRPKRNTGFFGPAAGHFLRICFCQPYDGAGKPTHDMAGRTLCMRKQSSVRHGKSKKESPRRHGKDVDVDAVLPNARVVTGADCKKSSINSARKRMRVRREQGGSTLSPNHLARLQGDGATDAGVAARAATVSRSSPG